MGKKIKEPKTTLEWALEYVKRYGWPVLPCYAVTNDGHCTCPPNSKERKQKDGTYGECKSPGKHPVSELVPRGSLDGTTDINIIKRWFGNGREYNLAIRTGENAQGNIMVTDLDVRKGKNGPATWEALSNEIGPFSETLWQITGSGGQQMFWWTNAEVPMNQETKLGPGIDIKGKSGYVLVPPSTNDMGDYSWQNWGSDILTAPPALEQRAIAGPRAASQPVTRAAAAPRPDNPHDRLTYEQVQEMVKAIPADLYDNWMIVGHILRTIQEWLGGETKAFELFDTWAQTGAGYGGMDDQK